MHPFLAALEERILILDGAMGTMLESLGLPDEYYGGHPGLSEALVINHPAAITQIHKAYLDAGADAVETATFGANRIKLAEHQMASDVGRINREAALLARQACDYATRTDGRR